jgi:hypothetical protein
MYSQNIEKHFNNDIFAARKENALLTIITFVKTTSFLRFTTKAELKGLWVSFSNMFTMKEWGVIYIILVKPWVTSV